jgi:hypothetical protein
MRSHAYRQFTKKHFNALYLLSLGRCFLLLVPLALFQGVHVRLRHAPKQPPPLPVSRSSKATNLPEFHTSLTPRTFNSTVYAAWKRMWSFAGT